jgi:hypothetical protein
MTLGGSPTTRNLAVTGIALAAQCAVAGACMTLLASGWSSATGDQIWSSSVLYTVIAAWSFWSWRRLTGRLVDPYSIFLLSFVLFSGGQLILHALGALPGGPLAEVFSGSTIGRTILVVNASLALLHLGAMLWLMVRPRGHSPIVQAYDIRRLGRIGVAFVAISLPPMLVGLYQAVHLVITEGYFGIYQQPMKVGVANLTGLLPMFLTPGLLMLLGTRPTCRWTVRFVWATASLKAASLLFVGQRGYAVMTPVPLLLLHDLFVRRVNRTFVAGIAAAAIFIAFPLVRAIRTLDAYERTTALRGGVEVQDPLTNTIAEMGGSMNTLAYTIDLVPSSRPYDNGAGVVRAVSTLIPNLFWERHPASAGSYGEWLVKLVNPWLAERGGALGFSVVAEGFINFGPFGGPIYCGLLGFIVAALLVSSTRTHVPATVIFAAITLSVILFYPRSEGSAILRAVVWCSVVPRCLVGRRGSSR